MAHTTALPSPAGTHRTLSFENDPAFGDYIYSTTTEAWTQRRAFVDGRPLLLCGVGRKPTTAQKLFWGEIEGRLDELTVVAAASVGPPPAEPGFGLFRKQPAFSAKELVLREVRLEVENSFEFFFNTPTGDRIQMWPVVTFTEWRVTAAEWAC
jgi:hypothetical protein